MAGTYIHTYTMIGGILTVAMAAGSSLGTDITIFFLLYHALFEDLNHC